MLSPSKIQQMIADLERQKAQLMSQLTSVESALSSLKFVLEKNDEDLTPKEKTDGTTDSPNA